MTIDELVALNHTLVIEGCPEGGFFCHFPDLLGCMTQGETYQEALEMAMDAKRAWIEVGVENGIEIPPPTYRG